MSLDTCLDQVEVRINHDLIDFYRLKYPEGTFLECVIFIGYILTFDLVCYYVVVNSHWVGTAVGCWHSWNFFFVCWLVQS